MLSMNPTHFKTTSSKELFSLALPMAFTQLIAVSSGFISMAMLSTFGADVIAASALIFSTRISILIIGSSILFALSILIGHAYGERNYLRVGNYMQLGWTIGVVISLLIMILYWKIHSILLFFGQSKVLADIVETFFKANIYNVIPFLLSVSTQQLCYGTRKQKIDLYANILGVIVLLSSAYILIYGHLGFPRMGVAGLGYALDLQGLFYFIFTISIIYFSDFFKRFDLFSFRMHQNLQDIIHLFNIAWPICVQISSEMLSFVATAAMVGWLGVQSLAAYQVVTQYLFLILVPLFALAQATGVLVGQAFGEKNYYKISATGYVSIAYTLVITLLVTVIFLIFPKPLAALYIDIHNPLNMHTVHLIVVLFAILSILQIIDGIRNVLTGSLRGLFDTRYPMMIGIIAIWLIGIPFGYLLAFHYHFGVSGIAIGSTLGMFFGMILLLRRWKIRTNFYLDNTDMSKIQQRVIDCLDFDGKVKSRKF